MRSLVDDLGNPITPSVAFRSLRDNISSSDPAVNFRRAYFETNVFGVLRSAGFRRESLQLAWDFTVSSTMTITERLRVMRDDALARTATNLPFKITATKDNPQPNIARRIQGTMRVPWYLNQAGPGINVRLVTSPGDVNFPLYNGDADATFTVLVPNSLVQNRTRGAVVQYGHGLFGDQGEVETAYLAAQADRYGYVLGASNWLGLSDADELFAADMLSTDVSDFPMIPDRCHQGVLNALLLMRLMTSDAFIADPAMTFNGSSVIDPTRRFYDGNSLGMCSARWMCAVFAGLLGISI